jgi:CheY-like chemotaxis protein
MTTRIFIVDDEPKVAEILETYLQKEIPDIEVICASDGKDAVEKMAAMLADDITPEMTLMDLRMPIMDGIESSKQLSEMGVENIHILTAYVDPELKEIAITVGAEGVIDKSDGYPKIAERLAAMVQEKK